MVIHQKWALLFSKHAVKDVHQLQKSNLKEKVEQLLNIIENNPYENPPHFEKLLGNLSEFYSRRINIQHRLVYHINKEKLVIKIISMWHHYDD